MAFKGDLTNISMFDVVQTLNTNQQTGVLVLQRAGVTKKIFFSPQGVRIFFMRAVRVLRLGEIFVRRGQISEQDVEILLMQQKQEYRPFGELLLETGKVTQEEMEHILRYHAEDEIYEIFGWDAGTFSFFEGETDLDHANTPLSEIVLDPGGLCLEAARRLDEMERLRTTVADDEQFFVRLDGVEINPVGMSPSALAVIEALAAPAFVDEIRDVVGMSRYMVLGGLVELLERGLARPLDTEELADEGRRMRDLEKYPRAAMLLTQAHEGDPINPDILEDCVSVLQKLNKPARLAAMLAKLGALRARHGDHERAIESLEQALRQNPGNREALVSLRDSLAATGDDERAAETSLRIARSYAEAQNVEGAIAACREGLEISPSAVALRYHYAQLLARAEENALAQAELRELIETTRGQKRALRNRKTRELLSSCYRLLLRLDPEDAYAEKGLKQLERQSNEKVRRRRLVLRSTIAAAVLLLVAGVGVALMPASAADLLEQAHELRDDGDYEGMAGVVQQLQDTYPDSPEAEQARALGQLVSAEELRRREEEAQARRESFKGEFEPRLRELESQMAEGDIQRAAGMLAETLKMLRPGRALTAQDSEILRNLYMPELTLKVEAFLERAREEMEGDIRYVSSAEQALTESSLPSKARLDEIVARLTRIRQRDWPDSALRIDAYVAAALDTGLLREIDEVAASFRRFFATRVNAFAQLTRVYYRAKSFELKENIRIAMEEARTRGRELLAQCEFAEARKYYTKVLEYTLSARDAEVREHYKQVIEWVVKLNIERVAKRAIDDIDEVTRSLAEVEELKQQGRADAAYRLMRSLIKEHRLIQFERRYKLPYRITSRPLGAQLYVGGELRGPTPCDIEMGIIERTAVRLEAPGFNPFERTLEIADPSLDGLLDVPMQKLMTWQQSLRGSPEARPVLAGGLVLVPTNEASLLALDVRDGHKVWEARSKLLDRIKAAPLTTGDRAHFVTGAGRLFTVKLDSGEIEHSLELPGEVQHDGLALDGTLYFATRNRRFVAVRDGKVIFDRELGFDPVTPLHPVADGILVGTAEGYLLVHARDDGREIERLQSSDRSSFFGGVTAFGDRIVGAAEDGYLYCFRRGETKADWRYRMSGSLASAPIAAFDSIYLPTEEGFLWRISAAGERTGRVDVRKSFNGTPVMHRGFLYGAAGPRIIAYDLKGDADWWEYLFEDDQPIHVAASDAGVVVVTERGRIAAFPPDERP